MIHVSSHVVTRYQFIIKFFLLCFLFSLTATFADAAITVKRGIQANPIQIEVNIVGGSGLCVPTTNYSATATDSVYSIWTSGQHANGFVDLGTSVTASPSTYNFRCVDGANSDSDTLTITDCLASETWNGSNCVPTVPTATLTINPTTLRTSDPLTMSYVLGGNPDRIEYYITGPINLASLSVPRTSNNLTGPLISAPSTIFGQVAPDGLYDAFLRACRASTCSPYSRAGFTITSGTVATTTTPLNATLSFNPTTLRTNEALAMNYSVTGGPTRVDYYITGPVNLASLATPRTSINVTGPLNTTPTSLYGGSSLPDGTYTGYLRGCRGAGNADCGGFAQASFTIISGTVVATTSAPTATVSVSPARLLNTDTLTISYTVGGGPDRVEYYITGPINLANATSPRRAPNTTGPISSTPNALFSSTVPDGTYTVRLRACLGGTCSAYATAAFEIGAPVVAYRPLQFSAGSNLTLTLPTNSIQPSGQYEIVGTDPIDTREWTFVSWPPLGNTGLGITAPFSINPTFTGFSVPGLYRARLSIETTAGFYSDDIDINVLPGGAPRCLGVPPANSSFWPGDDTGIATSTLTTHSVANTGAKCEFRCATGFTHNPTTQQCETPDLRALANTSAVCSLQTGFCNFIGTIDLWSAIDVAPDAGEVKLRIEVIGAPNAITDIWGSYHIEFNPLASPTLGPLPATPMGLRYHLLNYNVPLTSIPPELGAGYRYHWVVDAGDIVEELNEYNNSTGMIFFNIPVPPAPNNPTPFTGTAGTCGGRIDLTWGAAINAATYEIAQNAGFTTGLITGITGLSHTITGLTPATNYTFYLRARNSTGVSPLAPNTTVRSSGACNSLSVNGCTINDDQNSCIGRVTWDITGATAPSIYNLTRSLTVPGTSMASGTNVAVGLIRGTAFNNATTGRNVIEARDGVNPLMSRPANAECGASSFFNTGTEQCKPLPVITVNPSTTWIRSGQSAIIRFTITASYPTTCTVTGGVAAPLTILHNGTTVNPTQTHAVTTVDLTSAQIVQMSCTAPVLPTPVTAEARINVLPDLQEI